MQEPQLFTGTVADNIAYGIPDEEKAEMTREMIEVCCFASIRFIVVC